ncbi:hypothetical protein [Terrisporobacter sp.]
MSRLEKKLNRKQSKKKFKLIFRMIFIFSMILITVFSVSLIDYRVNEVLDEPSKNTITNYINIFLN